MITDVEMYETCLDFQDKFNHWETMYLDGISNDLDDLSDRQRRKLTQLYDMVSQ